MIDAQLKKILEQSIKNSIKKGLFAIDQIPELILEKPKKAEHGDIATNIAMILASKAKKNPMNIAEAIANNLPKNDIIDKVDVVRPGFINIIIKQAVYLEELNNIFKSGHEFGRLIIGKKRKVQVEFVSANPTGPLHIGHGRGAVYGDSLANVLKTAGFEVTKEYYVNDAGVQIQTLGKSIFLRIKELNNEKIDFPEDCYQGTYIIDLAKELLAQNKDKIHAMNENQAITFCGEYSSKKILQQIKDDLKELGIEHDQYFHEENLHTDAAIDRSIQVLKKGGFLQEKDGALWFNSTSFGDDKDRVLRKSDGTLTYFAADIAYHKNKYDRGFDKVIDIWGADHAGYVARMKAGVKALGYNDDSFEAVLIQLVNLVKDGQVVSMSTRKATYETLEDVRKEVGKDVCRYFFLMRSYNAQLDFDLNLAKKQTNENPVYYIQYAHARIASVFRKAKEKKISIDFSKVDLSELDLSEEIEICKLLLAYPDVIEKAATTLEPHRIAFYLLDLAKSFQSYYSKAKLDERYKMLSENQNKTISKLYLLKNCQIVIQNALGVLGISAPEIMTKYED